MKTDFHFKFNLLMPAMIILVMSACSPTQPIAPTATIISNPTSTATFTPTPILTPVRLGNYELLSPEDMRYDLDELFHRIETTHPDPYAKRPKAEVDIERQKIYDELDHPMTIFDYYDKVAPLVASLGDPHTQVLIPAKFFNEEGSKEKFIPLEIGFEDQQGFIIFNLSGNPDIPVGTEVLAINGKSIADIREEIIFHNLRYYPFPLGLWIMYGSIPKYELELLQPDQTNPVKVTIPGLSLTEFEQNASSESNSVWEPVTYTKVPDEPIGILTVNTFEEIDPLLTPIFAQIQEDSVTSLIIDIRSNGGGKYGVVDSLMDFLTDKPYKYCSKSYEAPFNGYGSGAPREVACDVIQPFNAAERFQGNLYVLIGPDTFSAAITFSTILQDYELATLIGEETNDTASYCANIVLGGTPLPRTGLRYTLSKTCYVRPSGVLDDNPVIPDIVVETTLEAGRDPVLEYTLDMIRSNMQTP